MYKNVILLHHKSVNMQIVDSAVGLKPDLCHWALVSNSFFSFFFPEPSAQTEHSPSNVDDYSM